MFSDVLLGLTVVLVVTVVSLIILLLVERDRRKPLLEKQSATSHSPTLGELSVPVRRTITSNVFNEARDRLRLLDLEREILSYAVRRLYEAGAEGKISDGERDRLALKYKMDLGRIKEEIARGESIVALNELEKMQEDFVQLFSERFEVLNKRIDELRKISGYATSPHQKAEETETLNEKEESIENFEEEEKVESPFESHIEEKTIMKPEKSAKKKSHPTPKRSVTKSSSPLENSPEPEAEINDAEKKVAQIVAEVEKVLQKLGQMEVDE